MTSSTHLDAHVTESRVGSIAVAATAGAMALNALGVWGDGTSGKDPEVGAFFVIAGVIVVAAAVVFGLVVPRLAGRPKAAGVGLGLSIAALVLTLAFWSGLPPILGAGGILLGQAARARGRGGHADSHPGSRESTL